jgi:RNase P subunit RPR2
MPAQDQYQWAKKIARKDIKRLYQSEALGMLDEELLDRVLYAIHARICDMFEVREAQQFGRVRCRSCGETLPQPFRMGSYYKSNPMQCANCGWCTTCGAFYDSYTGKDLLPGSRVDLFQEFLDRYPTASSSQAKMLLLDRLIHAFHVQSGVSGRLVAMNVIQGSRSELIELLTNLASNNSEESSKTAWLAEDNHPVRRFRKKYPSRKKILEIAARLGIQSRTKMPENELIVEILRLSPGLLEDS